MKNTTSLNCRRFAIALSAFPALVALGAPVLAEGSFTDLGTLGGTYSYASAISADGAVVVGTSNTAGNQQRVFRWDSINGMQDIGTFGGTYTNASAVSANGAVVVGYSYTAGNQSYLAFRWDGINGMQSLGTLGGTSSYASAVSANGAVVVGNSYTVGNQSYLAFRWDGINGMQSLGALGGTYSYASAVSANGAVVVGEASTAGNQYYHAYRWDGINGMQDLGTLGGTYSYAVAVSANGAVVVGEASTAGDQYYHAYRWDGINGMQDLGTLGGTYSYASAVSANGAVVVGNSNTTGDQYQHAYRWDGINGMQDIGTLGGTYSYARAVSANGAVVVGAAYNAGNRYQAFRWSTTDGMQSVDDWVTADGGAIPVGYDLTEATGVNDDGSIVTGSGRYNGNQVAWLAKGNGFLSDTAAFDRSLIEAGGSAASVGIATSNLALGGSHHRTLLDSGLVMSDNGICAWSTVDAARNDTTKATTTLGEIGICGDVAGYRIGAGVGTTKTKQDWDLGGSARYTGEYLLAEVDREFATAGGSTLQASLLVYHVAFDTTLNRAYASGAGIDVSTGRPDLKTSAVKARLDWKNATTMGAFSVSPYSTLTVTRAKVAGYTETGGAFPAVYAPTTTRTTDLRIGAAFAGKIAPKTTLHTQVEAVHQFQNSTGGINGEVTGLYAFSLPGQKLTQNWARITMDVDYALTPSTVLTAGFNAATKGNQSSAGITLGIRAAF